jgi:hypothetical protein
MGLAGAGGALALAKMLSTERGISALNTVGAKLGYPELGKSYGLTYAQYGPQAAFEQLKRVPGLLAALKDDPQLASLMKSPYAIGAAGVAGSVGVAKFLASSRGTSILNAVGAQLGYATLGTAYKEMYTKYGPKAALDKLVSVPGLVSGLAESYPKIATVLGAAAGSGAGVAGAVYALS